MTEEDEEDDEELGDTETRYYQVIAKVAVEAYPQDSEKEIKEAIRYALVGDHEIIIDDDEATFEITSVTITRK